MRGRVVVIPTTRNSVTPWPVTTDERRSESSVSIERSPKVIPLTNVFSNLPK